MPATPTPENIIFSPPDSKKIPEQPGANRIYVQGSLLPRHPLGRGSSYRERIVGLITCTALALSG